MPAGIELQIDDIAPATRRVAASRDSGLPDATQIQAGALAAPAAVLAGLYGRTAAASRFTRRPAQWDLKQEAWSLGAERGLTMSDALAREGDVALVAKPEAEDLVTIRYPMSTEYSYAGHDRG